MTLAGQSSLDEVKNFPFAAVEAAIGRGMRSAVSLSRRAATVPASWIRPSACAMSERDHGDEGVSQLAQAIRARFGSWRLRPRVHRHPRSMPSRRAFRAIKLSLGPQPTQAQSGSDQLQGMLLARINTAIRNCNLPSRLDDKSRRRTAH